MSKTTPGVEPSEEATETLLSHLIELRDRVLRMFIAVLVVFLILFPFANQLYTFLADPLMAHLPEGTSMIAIEVAAPFLIPFKLTLLLAVAISIPYLLYQLWAFIAPGLYQHEKSLAAPLVASSTILFYLGMAFAYFVVFPLIFAFFTAAAPEGVDVMTDISRYLDFVILLFIAFGIAFEMPVATILLVTLGATTTEKLAAKRPYVIVGVFLVGMVLTPPDIISQTLLALPMWLLFELGLILARIMERRKAQQAGAEDADDPDGPDGPDDPEGGPGGDAGDGPEPGDGPGDSGPRDGNRADARKKSSAKSSTAKKTSGTRRPDPAARAGYTPLSEAEMDAELDRIEAEADTGRKRDSGGDGGDNENEGDSTNTADDPGSGRS